MKKRLLGILAGVGAFIVLVPASVSAQTLVAGKVTNNGTPVNGATITAVCNSNSKDATTNKNGDYAVEYTDTQCPEGDKATVVASKNGMGGTSAGEVDNVGATLNIAIVNVAIPEFGLIVGMVGTVAAAAMFLIMRRRQTASVEQQV